MPLLVKHNIATELHILNGSIGRLVKVVREDEEQSCDTSAISNPTFLSNTVYIRKPLYALIQLPQCKLASALTDLQPTLVPIVPERKTIKVDLKSCLCSTEEIVTKQNNHHDHSLPVTDHSCLCNDHT